MAHIFVFLNMSRIKRTSRCWNKDSFKKACFNLNVIYHRNKNKNLYWLFKLISSCEYSNWTRNRKHVLDINYVFYLSLCCVNIRRIITASLMQLAVFAIYDKITGFRYTAMRFISLTEHLNMEAKMSDSTKITDIDKKWKCV